MWILPQQLKKSFLSAQDLEESSVDLSEVASQFAKFVSWRSKPSSAKTWLLRWKRVFWIPLLFGRTLKPSQQKNFADWWTASLEAIPVHHSHLPDSALVLPMNDTFGRLYELMSKQLDLFGASSKTLTTISPWDSILFTKTYALWVTQLRQEYSVRQKVAHHMRDRESSSWPTPHASPQENRTTKPTPSQEKNGHGKYLAVEVHNWPTPDTSDRRSDKSNQVGLSNAIKWPTPSTIEGHQDKELFQARVKRLKERNTGKNGTKYSGNGAGQNLGMAVQLWPTPTFGGHNQGSLQEWGGSGNKLRFATPCGRDGRDGRASKQTINRNSRPLNEQIVSGHLDQDSLNTTGNTPELSRGRLNPLWVCQLMGTTLEKIFFVHLETPLSNNKQK